MYILRLDIITQTIIGLSGGICGIPGFSLLVVLMGPGRYKHQANGLSAGIFSVLNSDHVNQL
jgi:hypothetical protein